MGMSIGGGGKHPSPHVNVTPLVDVALVVLIIFMVVTPLMTKTFWLNLPPKPDASAPTPPKKADDDHPPVVMTVAPDGTIRINKTVIDRARLPTELPRMLASRDKPVLFFDAQDATDYGVAVEVMDLARASGARSIAILTKNVSD